MAGQYFDAETGLHYNYHRYYDSKTGRCITPDPIGLSGGINLFVYALNNPINYIDPYGLYSWVEFGDDAANFSAGFGDTITFGGTAWIRDQWNNKVWGDEFDSVNPCSDSYKAGKWSGHAWEVGMGAAGGARALGWSAHINKYRHGGGGINLMRNGTRRYGADWHRFKHNARMVNRPHYHRGPTKSQMKKHRPWQGGW